MKVTNDSAPLFLRRPVLPDMLQSTQVQGEPADPRTTNLVTSLFTTAFNFGGCPRPPGAVKRFKHHQRFIY